MHCINTSFEMKSSFHAHFYRLEPVPACARFEPISNTTQGLSVASLCIQEAIKSQGISWTMAARLARTARWGEGRIGWDAREREMEMWEVMGAQCSFVPEQSQRRAELLVWWTLTLTPLVLWIPAKAGKHIAHLHTASFFISCSLACFKSIFEAFYCGFPLGKDWLWVAFAKNLILIRLP